MQADLSPTRSQLTAPAVAQHGRPEPVVIVCHCRVVSDRAIDKAVTDGARTLGAVCRATGAAQDCATCIFTVKSIACRRQEVEQILAGEVGLECRGGVLG